MDKIFLSGGRAIYVLIADREEQKSTLSFDQEEYKGYWSNSGS
jgi:hypothetical protein